MVVQEPVRAAIWYALNNYNYDDAIFLAERLHAEVDCQESSYLLATCYFRSGRVQQARHALGQHRGDPRCELLYARCCLQLNDLKSGLLALNGLLCLGGEREDEMAARFGDDRGVAFWLLGEINRRLHQPKEAAKHFRSCLRFNPFLWTAYQALCEIGESVPAEECFKLSELPAFLKTSHDSIPNTAHLVPGGAPPTSTQEALKPLENVAAGISERRSAFTLVGPPKPSLVTPGLFGPAHLGQAVASSTPVPRALAFTKTSEKRPRDRGADTVTPFALEGGAKPGGGTDSLGGLRGALSFGSSRPTRIGRGWGQGGATPISPSFGTLLPTLHSGSTQCQALPAKHSLNFSTITPSPSSLPADYLSSLQSAPKSVARSTAGKTPLPLAGPRFNLHFDTPTETPDSQSFPTPDTNPATARGDTPDSTNDISPVSSHDSASPPAGDTPPMPPPKAPAKTAPLRRSARLSGIGKSPSSMAISRRRPENTPSSLALHSTRAKSRLKPPAERVRGALTGGKGHRVTFTTPVTNRKGRPYTVTPAPLGDLNSDSLGPPAEEPSQQMPPRLPVSSAGVPGAGVRGDGVISDTQRSLELAALAGIGSLLQLLGAIGSAYHSLCQYNLLAAVRGFRSLPPHHHHTPWVLSQLARAFFVGERLRESAKIFEEVHRMDPHRQEGMELYASVLWHLQRETELSVLAEALHTSDKLRPEALCAMATVMNTYKDHDSAVKFLQRAIQVSPQFAYAHTLLGHEHWLIKDYDKSLASFQTATTIDPRHYNAWYGMAHVYYTQEKYRFAEVYAGRALAINKGSSIACTQLALAQFRQGSLSSSLRSLERATTLNPGNPIPRFHRAKVLEAMGRLEEALEQLEELTVMWPREPSLCVGKGKLLKQLNRPHEAVLQFSWALDFNRGGSANQIRDELDQAYPSQDTSSMEQEDRDFTPHFDPEQGSDDSDGSMDS